MWITVVKSLVLPFKLLGAWRAGLWEVWAVVKLLEFLEDVEGDLIWFWEFMWEAWEDSGVWLEVGGGFEGKVFLFTVCLFSRGSDKG